MSDIEQMSLNLFRKNQRLMQALEKKLPVNKPSNLNGGTNFRYVLEFTIDATDLSAATNDPAKFVTQSFITRHDRQFIVTRMECATIVTGTVNGSAARLDLAAFRRAYGPYPADHLIDFTWRVSDSSSDGQWSNTALPANVLLSGSAGGLRFAHGRPIKGGTEVTMNVLVGEMTTDLADPTYPISDITAYILQFSFIGVERAG